jgi:hypothetical protein
MRLALPSAMRSGRVRVHSNVDVDAFGIDTVSTPSRLYNNITKIIYTHSDVDRCS